MAQQASNLISGVNVTISEITKTAIPTGMQPSSTGSLFNSALPTAEANWLTDITVSADGVMRVTVQVSITGILRAVLTRSAVVKPLNLYETIPLVASALYTFDIPVKSGDTFNLRYSTTTGTIDFCEVQFIKGGV